MSNPHDSHERRVLVCDSGIGGLGVVKAIRNQAPDLAIDYLADNAAFPYGDWAECDLIAHGCELVGRLVEIRRADVVVIACNTASTLWLPQLRQRLGMPIVGTVPAIKPAALQTRSGLISVLATPGTVRRDYTKGLISRFAGHVNVRLVGSAGLAQLAEDMVRVGAIDMAELSRQIRPGFVERDGQRTDTIVLACTHYPFLMDAMKVVSPWEVNWIDPAPAIARRVEAVARQVSTSPSAGSAVEGRMAYFTGHAEVPGNVASLLRGLGLTQAGW